MAELNRRTFLHGAGMATAAGVGAGLVGSPPAGGQAAAKDESKLGGSDLDYLRRFDTPTIANALEREPLQKVHGRGRLDGVMSPKRPGVTLEKMIEFVNGQ